jgi:hypothetical protein
MSETITASLTVSGGDVITAEINTLARGPAGPAGEGGSGAITNATTSDGTANLSISNVSTATGSVSGILTAPTAVTATSTTQVATTAFVQQELASGVAVAKNLEFLAHNGSGSTIAKGSIVYINGAVGGVPRVVKAQANNDTNSARTIGFAKTDIADGANGFVISQGELENVRTADDSGIIGAGIQLYLSPTTPGAFTRTKPSAPQHLVYVGVVVTASTGVALDGKILVGIQNGYELDEIHDVSISSPAAGQVIKRNAGNTLWINESIISTDVSDSTATGRSLMTAATQAAANQVLGMLSATATGTTATTGVTTDVVSITIPSAGFWRIEALSTFTNATSSSTLMSLLFDSALVIPASNFRIGQAQVVTTLTALLVTSSASRIANIGATNATASSELNATAFGLIRTTGASVVTLRISNTAGSGTSTLTQGALVAIQL